MNTIRILISILILSASVCYSGNTIPHGGWSTYVGNKDVPKVYPQYLLVYMEWRSSPNIAYINGAIDVKSLMGEWKRKPELYNSIEDVIEALNKYALSHGDNKDLIVGLWKLNGKSDNIFDKVIKQVVTEKVEPEIVKKKRWKEYKWERK